MSGQTASSAMKQLLILVSLIIPIWASACKKINKADIEGNCIEQFAMADTDVILKCNGSEDSALVTWKVNNTDLAPRNEIVLTSGTLMLLNASVSLDGEYTCHRDKTGEIMSNIHLRMGYPPSRPLIKCYSVSYPESVRCTWKLEEETHIPTHFIVSYRYGIAMNEEVKNCKQIVPEESSCIIRDIHLFSVTPYTLNVTAVNPLGSTSKLHQFIVEDIIKPDPPEEVTVSQIEMQRRKLFVQWKPPSSWPELTYFPLKYRIRYWQDGTSMFRMIGPYEETFFTLVGLRPKTKYHIEVSAKDFTDSGEDSDWSHVVSAAPWTST
ncbi:interleukin-27 subunit beta [Protopterus annectens]|uniref:interleukin-27 subunit beta n=1 Tax=Protopterus annectens TaxID=7888 RepID=UPI001CFA43C0|nr:interleukin-27 subunit beta [Protopterus annectens]